MKCSFVHIDILAAHGFHNLVWHFFIFHIPGAPQGVCVLGLPSPTGFALHKWVPFHKCPAGLGVGNKDHVTLGENWHPSTSLITSTLRKAVVGTVK